MTAATLKAYLEYGINVRAVDVCAGPSSWARSSIGARRHDTLMRMKQTILFTLSVIAEIDDEGLEAGEFGEADRMCNKLIDAVNAAVPEGWQAARQIVLDPKRLNCGHCAECDNWVTDCEQPEPLEGLCNGAVFEGRLLCDEHLPPSHRWAF